MRLHRTFRIASSTLKVASCEEYDHGSTEMCCDWISCTRPVISAFKAFGCNKELQQFVNAMTKKELIIQFSSTYIYKDKSEFLASVDEVINEFARSPRRFDFGISI